MAASITLEVQVNKAKAAADIQAVERAADALTKTPHVINFTTSGGDVVIKQAKSAATALGEAAAAEQRRMAAEQNRAAAAERHATAEVNAASRSEQAQARAALQTQRHADRMEELAQRANQASTASNALSVALGNIAARGLHLALSKITQGIREALTEMKSVDTELTNISKVSGKTGAELAAIGDAAYETANKYGESASTYLAAVYNMQKAGMGDDAEAMGELAIKTMLVGDTTEDVASKFLIASNAAWNFQGNMDKLNTLVDEADYINNNYATSLDKLAAGMPIVASTSANLGMSAEETLAVLGTITSLTQESGTKAATAWRALAMNITGELGTITTETGETIEVTKESVKSMSDALLKYGNDAVKAAKKTGEIIDPMLAVESLAQAYKDGLLTDIELENILMDVGGKLRTNQLTALVKDLASETSTYRSIMEGLGDAAGTADSEIALMMESWERKTQVLKNTWTEFIADIVSTDAVKGGIDWLTGIVDGLDGLVKKSKNPFYDSEQANHEIDETAAKIRSIRDEMDSLGDGGIFDQTRLENLMLELQIQEEILELKQKQYKLEHEEDAKRLQTKLTENYYDAMGRPILGDVNSADTEALFNMEKGVSEIQYENAAQYQEALKGVAEATKEYYDQVKLVQDILGDGVLTDAQKEFISTWEEVSKASTAEGLHVDSLVDGIDGAADAYYRLVDAEGNVVAYTENTAKNIREQIDAIDERNAAEVEGAENTFSIADAFVAYDTAASRSMESLLGLTEETEAAGAATESVESAAGDISFDDATQSAGELTGELRAAAAAAAAISVGPMGGLLGVGFATGTTNAPGGPTLVNELGPELISENGKAYIANGGKPGIVNLSKGAIVLTARETREAIRGGGTKKSIHAAALGASNVADNGGKKITPVVAYGAVMYNGQNIANTGNGTTIVVTPAASTNNNNNNNGDGKDPSPTPTPTPKPRGAGGGTTATAKAAKSIEDYAKETKDVLSNLEKQAKLADNRGQYSKEASLYGKAQSEIDKMVARYKKAGYKETDDEILDLLNKRYDYEKKKDAASKKTIEEAAKELKDKLSNLDKQADVAEKQEDYLSQVQFYEKAQEAIKEMVERYRKAGYKDDSDEILDLLKKNYDYADKQVKVYQDRWNDLIDALESDAEEQELANALAEKQQAVEDARLALENAQKQRTIRVYNASTGQWEWVNDQSKVKSAQESLTKAEKNYADEVKDQAVKEIEHMRDTLVDLNDAILGPALSAVVAMSESSAEFQNFARALNAVYGVGSYLSSTEGSSNVISTASDSHDTIYTFGNVALTEEQASSMSVAELAQKLQVLKIS